MAKFENNNDMLRLTKMFYQTTLGYNCLKHSIYFGGMIYFCILMYVYIILMM